MGDKILLTFYCSDNDFPFNYLETPASDYVTIRVINVIMSLRMREKFNFCYMETSDGDLDILNLKNPSIILFTIGDLS